RAQVRRELPLQVPDEQVDAELRGRRGYGHPYSPRMVKCLPSSACGRGITCTDTSSPTAVAVSAPASVAAFTAPTSPMMVTATSPSPTWSRPTLVTFPAFPTPSPPPGAPTIPFAPTIPIAFPA